MVALSLILEPRAHTVPSRRVLAAVDLGSAGEDAIRLGHEHAVDTGGCFAVCHVMADPGGPARVAEIRVELFRMLARTLGRDGVAVEVFTPTGDPASAILTCAQAWRAQLLVVGRPARPRGLLARLVRRSLIDRLLRRASCAVLVAGRAPGTGRIVSCTDLSDRSIPVLAAAVEEQARTGASIHLVHSIAPGSFYVIGEPGTFQWTPTWHEIEAAARRSLVASARTAGLHAAPMVTSNGASALLRLVDDLDPDLVIVGSRAARIVRQVGCSVMVVRA